MPGAPLSRPPAASAARWNARTCSRFSAAKATWIGPGGMPWTPIQNSGRPSLPSIVQPSPSSTVWMPSGASERRKKLALYWGLAQAQPDAPGVRYEPSPAPVVEAMTQLAAVKPGDVVYDLGCGDGRIVIAAAKLGAS